ncbi:hypothetical protein AB0J38_02125 [Streptomyces sp. NPDC050095]|uniref:AbiTii domain-containing protein n=1 Tax=unclassified Streptomyces TaxID=2593676 RepID=UPI003422F0FD
MFQPTAALDRLEHGVLDPAEQLADLLRYVLLLGGYAASESLKNWATRELRGYVGVASADVPDYRRVPAALKADSHEPGARVTGQTISRLHLPEITRGQISEELVLPQGVFQLSLLAKEAAPNQVLRMALPGAAELCALMSASPRYRQARVVVEDLYWAVSPSELHNILDQVRTRLTQFVAELRQTMGGDLDPTPSQVRQAAQVISITAGDNASITVTAPFAYADGSASAVSGLPDPDRQPAVSPGAT